MYKQDIELAKLLLSKLGELNVRTGELQDELQVARDELEDLEQQRAEREQYSEILSRAANMLERTDLKVDSPDLTNAESSVAEVTAKLDDINQEAEQFRTLVDELRERAPQLLEAVEAGIEAQAEPDEVHAEPPAELNEQAPPAPSEPEQTEDTPELAEPSEAHAPDAAAVANDSKEPEPEITEETHHENPGPEIDEEVAAERAADSASNAADPTARFLIEQLKTKEAFTWGRGATFIIDATTVLTDVQHYNSELYQQDDHAMRDRLIRDLDNFSKVVTGNFYIVFSSWHQPVVHFSNDIHLEYVSGEAEGTTDGIHTKIEELAATFSSSDRSVCIITNDSYIHENLNADRLFKIELEGFFRM